MIYIYRNMKCSIIMNTKKHKIAKVNTIFLLKFVLTISNNKTLMEKFVL